MYLIFSVEKDGRETARIRRKSAGVCGRDMRIIIDSREQRPYRFPYETIRKALPAGDYSLDGYLGLVAIERKSKEDAYGTIGAGRKRFVAELERLATYDYAAIVIECGLADFLKPPKHSRLHQNSAINSLIAWSVRYGVHVFFADTRLLAQTLTLRILEKFYKGQTKTR